MPKNLNKAGLCAFEQDRNVWVALSIDICFFVWFVSLCTQIDWHVFLDKIMVHHKNFYYVYGRERTLTEAILFSTNSLII